jgi:hypothetical protein
MKNFNAYIIAVVLALTGIGCNRQKDKTEIIAYTKVPINSILYIKNVSLLGEKEQIIDSAIVVNNHDSVRLFVPREEKAYRMTIKGDTRLQATFINESKIVRIHLDYFANTYTVNGSPASASLRKFISDQTLFAKNRFTPFNTSMDSLKRLHIMKGAQYDTLISRYNAQLRLFFKRYIGYADTVKSPAAFLMVYKLIDFNEDYDLFKKFVLRNTARFAGYKAMAQVKKEAMDEIRVHEEEFNVGDVLPSVTLPDINGKPFSTGSLRGQYYLIDFWGTYCPQCGAFKAAEMKLFEKGPLHVKLVSVAMDDEKKVWQTLVAKNKMNWVNLIDVQMWTGPAVNTLLFDSIPFNFLVAPNGKIIKKAIKPDSLLKVISSLKAN